MWELISWDVQVSGWWWDTLCRSGLSPRCVSEVSSSYVAKGRGDYVILCAFFCPEAMLRLCYMFITVCGHAVKTGRAESQFTQHDTDPLLSTINSSDKKTTQRSQVVHRTLYLNAELDISIQFLNSMHLSFATGGWCWPQVQYRRCDKGQHRDGQRLMGFVGVTRPPARHWHSSSLFRKPLPLLCMPLSASLTRWPGPCQAELSHLLWADQWERQSTHGCLRPQVMETQRVVLRKACWVAGVSVCNSSFITPVPV